MADRNSIPLYVRIAIGLVLLVLLVLLPPYLRRSPSNELVEKARKAYLAGDPEAAGAFLREAVEREPDNSSLLIRAAGFFREMRQFDEAIAFYDRVPSNQSDQYVAARLLKGDVLLDDLARPTEARDCYASAVELSDNDDEAVQKLIKYHAALGHVDKVVELQLQRIRTGKIKPGIFFALGLSDQIVPDGSLMQRWHDSDPNAAEPLAGLARIAVRRHEFAEAIDLFRRSLTLDPSALDTQLRYGELLLEHGEQADFVKWWIETERLPGFQEAPRAWRILGKWAARNGQHDVAAGCFGESVRREPNSRIANYEFGTALKRAGRSEQALPFLERAKLLERYAQVLDVAMRQAKGETIPTASLRTLIDMARELGFPWEQFGWGLVAADQTGDEQEWIDPGFAEFRESTESENVRRESAAARLAANIDLAGFDVPRPPVGDVPENPAEKRPTRSLPPRFTDVAAKVGIAFKYFNDGSDLFSGAVRPFDFTGGGVAALDYDVDGWPDLYFAQGATMPLADNTPLQLDRIYRNQAGQRYLDVTAATGIRENRYSQGVTVGDFNSDGFPDLFVGNIGPNRLFQNNGDGTFDEIPLPPQELQEWTTSTAIVDVNADGHPDLYAVNYLSGSDVLTRICRDKTGPVAVCTPNQFDGTPDRLLLNNGAGQFHDVSADSGLDLPDAKGLGIVVADFQNDGRLQLFIANDGAPNFLLDNQAPPGESPRFQDTALLSGVALNRDGMTEACMGISVEDFNADGRLDFFVTNFYDETNTLYTQTDFGTFEDTTPASGLAESSRRLLGFGVQAIDPDLDGRLDLFITNGHVDDYTERGEPYAMPPQFFRNRDGSKFELVEMAQLGGGYFDGEYLGRSLARLDYNRDLADDLALSHLMTPVALLNNQTRSRGHAVAIQLVATDSARDAIGATVTATVGKTAYSRQLIAGDGYQSSNQRQLIFGLGNATTVSNLTVKWPSGTVSRFTNLPADQELVIVEGVAAPFSAP